MALDSQDDLYRDTPARLDSATGGLLRIALLFGSAVVALALIATMVLDGGFDDYAAVDYGIDSTATGSIGYAGTYVVRKSVLQSSPDAICIMRDNGSRSGDC